MKVFNTMTRSLEEFVPLEDGHVRMYTCGPTVYNYAHVGNYRAYVFEDILRRYLKFSGFRVTQVMNLTDVDDKTIRGAKEAGVPLAQYSEPYIKSFFEDLGTLNIEPAEHYPAATGHIKEMIELIGRLFDSGHAYSSDDGSVYFNVGKFAAYGNLAHLDMSGLRGGARVAQDEYDKENVADFALWKSWDRDDGDVAWDSPWGKGRPGWHIECSAMSMKYLGETFDLHTGGIDNMFPHHENEIAQSQGATGKEFVRYWMHCGYLIVDGKKMAKSLGNFHTLRDIVERGYTGREVRYVLLSGHYRQSLNFTFDALRAARASLARLDDFRYRLQDIAWSVRTAGNSGELPVLPGWASEGEKAFRLAMDDDLNVAEALGALFEMARAGNKAMDAGLIDARQAAGAVGVLESLDRVLGLFGGAEDKPDAAALGLLDLREQARGKKNWAESDRIRDELVTLGWDVRDTPDGQKLKKRRA